MAHSGYQPIKDSLRQLYLDAPRPWLVGYSGAKDSTMVASLNDDYPIQIDISTPSCGHSRFVRWIYAALEAIYSETRHGFA
jgi:hypothetical protein